MDGGEKKRRGRVGWEEVKGQREAGRWRGGRAETKRVEEGGRMTTRARMENNKGREKSRRGGREAEGEAEPEEESRE